MPAPKLNNSPSSIISCTCFIPEVAQIQRSISRKPLRCLDSIMVPRRPAHQAQPSLISDYESDGHYLSDIPPPAERTDEELNLSVLRRYRSDVMSLEYVVPYVVVYTFSPESLSWEKSGIEGSTFLCGLLPNGEYTYRCAVVLLNRRNFENLNIELTSSENVDITGEYIILKTDADEQQFYGLWVFREPPPSSTAHHPDEFAKKLQECAQRAEQSRRKSFSVSVSELTNGHDEQEESVPMGRQISLRELFGQQRQEDDALSMRSHSPSQKPSITQDSLEPPLQPPGPTQVPQFFTSADTDFFRTSASHLKPSHASQMSGQANGHKDTLLDLFRKASEKQGP